MINLLYGTGNAAKVKTMQDILRHPGIALRSLADMPKPPPQVDETGRDPLQNACIKARAYYQAYGVPVFSCDSGLVISELPPQAQPGVHVRTIGGKYLDDAQMIAHYRAIARAFGGKCTARYRNGICLVMGDGQVFSYDGDDIGGEEFYIVDAPHPKRNPGYPLDSLSVHIKTGRYYYDTETPVTAAMEAGFRAFFARALGINPDEFAAWKPLE